MEYNNKIPKIYANGSLVVTGTSSSYYATVDAGFTFGGPYGIFSGPYGLFSVYGDEESGAKRSFGIYR